MKKRVLAAVLAVALVLAALPMAVLGADGGSYDSDAEALADEMKVRVNSGTSIQYFSTLRAAVEHLHTLSETVRIQNNVVTLLDDLTGSGIPVGYEALNGNTTNGDGPINITLDLNGKTYTVTAPGVGSSGTETNGFQLLKESTVTIKNGTIQAGNTDVSLLIQNYCRLTLQDVTLDITQGNSLGYALSNNFGNVTVSGNTNIIAPGANQTAFDLYYWPSNGYTRGVTVTFDETMTGTVQGKIEYGSDGSLGAADLFTKAKLDINGGNFEGEFTSTSCNIADANINVTDGTFNTDVTNYVDSLTPYATLNGTHYVGETNVQAAAASAPSGSTITVRQGDVSLNPDSGVTVVNTGSGTVYIDGRTLSPGAFYTVPYPPATHDDLLIARLPDGSNQPVQVVVTLDRLLSGPYGGYQFDHGVATLSIAPGQTLYIHQLPVGTNYTITLLDGTVVSGSALTGTILPGVDAVASFTALPGVTPDLPGGEIVEGEEEIVEPGEEEGDVQEGTEETPPEEIPEEGLKELPEEGEDLPEEPVDVPQTGDAAPSIGLAILLGLAVCAIALKKVRAK